MGAMAYQITHVSICLLNRLFRHRIKKTPKPRITVLCERNPPVAMDSPHKGLVTRKMFPVDDVIMKKAAWHCEMSLHTFNLRSRLNKDFDQELKFSLLKPYVDISVLSVIFVCIKLKTTQNSHQKSHAHLKQDRAQIYYSKGYGSWNVMCQSVLR